MHDDATRSGRSKWLAHLACVLLFLLLAPGLGVISAPIAVLGIAQGGERAFYLWQTQRRMLGAAVFIWLGLLVTSMLVPIWGHAGFVYVEDGNITTKHHDHYLWELDHIH